VAGIAGNLFGGMLGDWWQRHMKTGRPMMLFWLMQNLLVAQLNATVPMPVGYPFWGCLDVPSHAPAYQRIRELPHPYESHAHTAGKSDPPPDNMRSRRLH
jgi:hypothetical protein